MKKFCLCISNFLDWYLGEGHTPKDITELILSILAIIIILLGFLINKTYYEDVTIEYYPIEMQQDFPKNIFDEIKIDDSPNKIVIVSPENVPMTVDVKRFKNLDKKGEPQFENTNITKKIEPGDGLKILYSESEGIPNYELHISTKYGQSDVRLDYNGRYGNINKTKIKSTRKAIPYFISKIFN